MGKNLDWWIQVFVRIESKSEKRRWHQKQLFVYLLFHSLLYAIFLYSSLLIPRLALLYSTLLYSTPLYSTLLYSTAVYFPLIDSSILFTDSQGQCECLLKLLPSLSTLKAKSFSVTPLSFEKDDDSHMRVVASIGNLRARYIYQSVSLSAYSSILIPIFFCPSICLSVCLSVCLSICLSVYSALLISLSVCLCLYLYHCFLLFFYCRNYKIPEADLHTARGIAGKITPAIATTTALVTGTLFTNVVIVLYTHAGVFPQGS